MVNQLIQRGFGGELAVRKALAVVYIRLVDFLFYKSFGKVVSLILLPLSTALFKSSL